MNDIKDFYQKAQVIILVGGKATRLSTLGQLIPKALLPISNEQTLLSRIIDQLIEAEFKKIVVSSSLYNFNFFREFIARYKLVKEDLIKSYQCEIQILPNDFHHYSPIQAFYYAINQVNSEYYILCLGDIFYFKNPFINLDMYMKKQNQNYLFIHHNSVKSNLKKGGIALVKEELIDKLYYHYQNCLHLNDLIMASWSGGAIFNFCVKEDIEDFIKMNNSPILEDYLNFSIDRGQKFYPIPVEKFINVNNYADFIKVISRC
jgi:NDP-sugar pyrophosphorylase family protein